MDCIFCKIIAGEIPCHKLAETDQAIAFLDIMPVTRGHLLVIPKQHVEFVHEAEPELTAHMMSLATRLARAVKQALNCDGMNLILNCGACAGQVVPHVHLHVVPRYLDDGIHWPWPQGTLTDEAAVSLTAAIKGRL